MPRPAPRSATHGSGSTDYLPSGSSLKFCRLAEGAADVYPRYGRTMEWDTAAGQAILEAAGGRVMALDGDDGGRTASLRQDRRGLRQSQLSSPGEREPAAPGQSPPEYREALAAGAIRERLCRWRPTHSPAPPCVQGGEPKVSLRSALPEAVLHADLRDDVLVAVAKLELVRDGVASGRGEEGAVAEGRRRW